VVLVLSVRDARTDHEPACLSTTTPVDDIQDAVTEMTSVAITSEVKVPGDDGAVAPAEPHRSRTLLFTAVTLTRPIREGGDNVTDALLARRYCGRVDDNLSEGGWRHR
jgi:hypothetical protein